MNHLLELCLVTTLATIITTHGAAQSNAGAPPPMQKGISVQLPVTTSATAIPEADQPEALVVSITSDGSMYVGVKRVIPAALQETLKVAVANRNDKTLYFKADARIPYANVVTVIDAVRTSGVEVLNLLTAQPESRAPGSAVPPKGIRICLVSHCTEGQ